MTNSKDKDYSLLGLFQNAVRPYQLDSRDPNLLIIDYAESTSVAKVYASVVRAIVVLIRRLEIF